MKRLISIVILSLLLVLGCFYSLDAICGCSATYHGAKLVYGECTYVNGELYSSSCHYEY